MPHAVEFVVGLSDLMSGPARHASQSVSKFGHELKSAKSALSAFQGQLSRAKSLGDIEGYRHYSSAVADAQRNLFELSKRTDATTESNLGRALKPVIGGILLATEVAKGMVEAYASIAEKALEAANAEATFQRQTKAAFRAFGGDEGGDRTYEQFERLSKWIPIAKEQLVDWTKSLQAAGVTDTGGIRRGLLALSGSEALVGKGGADNLLGTIRRVQEAAATGQGIKLADRQLASLAKSGVNVKDVAEELGVSAEKLQKKLKAGTQEAGPFGDALLNAVEKKGRGPLQKMWLDLDVLKKKGLEFANEFFRGVDLTPATDAVQRFLSLLDQSTAAGSDLEAGVQKGTNGIVKDFAAITDAVTIAYLKIATFALNADTVLQPLERRVKSIFNTLTGTSFGKLLLGAATLGGYDPHGKSEGPKPTPAGASAADKLRTAAGAVARARVTGALSGDDLQEAGDKLSDSLAAGIKQGLITREEGVKLQGIALGKAAIEGVKKGSDSHSPSRATFAIGAGGVGEGLVIGMRSRASDVGRSARFLGETATRASLYAATAPRGAEAAAFAHRAGRGGGAHIDRVEVSISAPHGVTDATELSAYGMSVALERQQLMGGG